MATTIVPTNGAAPLWTHQGVGATPGYAALDDRRVFTPALRAGVLGSTDFQVIQRAAGANMSVDIVMPAAGMAYVAGSTITNQGLYAVPAHSANINETITTASGSNPRIDSIYLQIQDNIIDSSGQNRVQTVVVTGTATTGATLTNRTGAGAAPASSLLLADILVPTSSTSVTTANIADCRTGSVGPLPAQIVVTAASTADFGWLVCDGSAISRFRYAALFARISTTYGVGDGTNTFNLPDLRGRAPLGVGTATGAAGATAHTLGQVAGEETHQITSAEMASHVHNMQGGLVAAGNTVGPNTNVLNTLGAGGVSGNSGNAGADTPHNNLTPYVGMNWQIRF